MRSACGVEPQWPELVRRLPRDYRRCDGPAVRQDPPRDEAVAHCRKGLPDFHALLGRAEGCARACLYAFDLLLVGAEDLRGLTLVERRTLLRKYLRRAGAAIIYTHDPTNNRPSNLKALLPAATCCTTARSINAGAG